MTKDGEEPQTNVLVSQHVFSLRMNTEDELEMLEAVWYAGVVTEGSRNAADREQVINNGGPREIQEEVGYLGGVTQDQL